MEHSEEIDENSPGVFENVKVNPLGRNAMRKPRTTYFFEGQNGTVFAAEEQEVANRKYMKKLRFLGWSDGTTYAKTINDAQLKAGQVIPLEDAKKLLNDAFAAELEVAKKNLVEAKENNSVVPLPSLIEWYFDSSVPEHVRPQIANNAKYGNATTGKDI